jgi:hypothetical protein
MGIGKATPFKEVPLENGVYPCSEPVSELDIIKTDKFSLVLLL